MWTLIVQNFREEILDVSKSECAPLYAFPASHSCGLIWYIYSEFLYPRYPLYVSLPHQGEKVSQLAYGGTEMWTQVSNPESLVIY
jgi:hypothetical protein